MADQEGQQRRERTARKQRGNGDGGRLDRATSECGVQRTMKRVCISRLGASGLTSERREAQMAARDEDRGQSGQEQGRRAWVVFVPSRQDQNSGARRAASGWWSPRRWIAGKHQALTSTPPCPNHVVRRRLEMVKQERQCLFSAYRPRNGLVV